MSFRKPPPPISCFLYILVRLHQIFQILVPIPYNTPIIMEGRDKNFEDPMQSDRDIKKTRHGRKRFLSNHPLINYNVYSDLIFNFYTSEIRFVSDCGRICGMHVLLKFSNNVVLYLQISYYKANFLWLYTFLAINSQTFVVAEQSTLLGCGRIRQNCISGAKALL